ncbi:STAS domain-containing protein, partial [Amycolatopsis sp. NPDC049252]|uniref:STAS domain-containing protein n=1 Tax=Amycolatopsis sp. NPDC049252 TaxID=3363933 RepID=UPI003715E443
MSELSPVPPTETPAWSPLGEPLRVRRHHGGAGLLVITAEGELDLVGAQVLERALAEDLPRHTVLDLSGVTFLAAAGLQVLVNAAAHAERDGRR